MMKLAEIMPRLLKAIIVKIRTNRAAKRFAPCILTPNRNTPINRYARTRIEAKMKFQRDEKTIISEVLVGVTSMASRVPIICSFRMLPEKLLSPVIRYVEKAMPIRTKEK